MSLQRTTISLDQRGEPFLVEITTTIEFSPA